MKTRDYIFPSILQAVRGTGRAVVRTFHRTIRTVDERILPKVKPYSLLLLGLALLLPLSYCTDKEQIDKDVWGSDATRTSWAKTMVKGANGFIAHVESDTTWQIAEGVDVLKMGFQSDEGLVTKLFLFKVRLSDQITLRNSLPDDGDRLGAGQQLMGQLKAMERHGTQVLGGTNADFFNQTIKVPYGVIWRDGVCIKGTFSRKDCNVFMVTKENTAHCLSAAQYTAMEDKSEIKETFCGRSTLLIKGGKKLDQSKNTMKSTDMHPRTCVGVSADGKTVYILVVDGRSPSYSNGANLYDLMNLMAAAGATDAINLDGGGSSTFIARGRVSGELELQNRPSDSGGVMRRLANGLAIVVR